MGRRVRAGHLIIIVTILGAYHIYNYYSNCGLIKVKRAEPGADMLTSNAHHTSVN